MNKNIKYNPKCVVILKLIDLLYDLPDCGAGGCCHVVTDDGNIYDRDLQFVINFCKDDRNKNAIDKEVSTLICTMMLELSFIERVILCEMRNIYGYITEELWNHYVEHELTEETLEDYDFNDEIRKECDGCRFDGRYYPNGSPCESCKDFCNFEARR